MLLPLRWILYAEDGDISMPAAVGLFALSGQAVHERIRAEAGTFTLTGQTAGAKLSAQSAVGLFSLTGGAVPDRGISDVGLFALSGQDVGLRVILPISVEVYPHLNHPPEAHAAIEPGSGAFVVVDEYQATVTIEQPVPGEVVLE